MKQGSRVIHKVTKKIGIIDRMFAPGAMNHSVVCWDGEMEGYYINRADLELYQRPEERNTA